MDAADDRTEVDEVDIPVDGPETIAEKRLLANFGRSARAVNLARVVRLTALLDSSEAGTLDEAGRREAENLAHQVVGSAGTFGFPSASVEAVSIEDHFASLGEEPGDPGNVRAILERLRAEFADRPGRPGRTSGR
jgi:HPt (histidine-containing phosphotransfer) domain-containing protein